MLCLWVPPGPCYLVPRRSVTKNNRGLAEDIFRFAGRSWSGMTVQRPSRSLDPPPLAGTGFAWASLQTCPTLLLLWFFPAEASTLQLAPRSQAQPQGRMSRVYLSRRTTSTLWLSCKGDSSAGRHSPRIWTQCLQ